MQYQRQTYTRMQVCYVHSQLTPHRKKVVFWGGWWCVCQAASVPQAASDHKARGALLLMPALQGSQTLSLSHVKILHVNSHMNDLSPVASREDRVSRYCYCVIRATSCPRRVGRASLMKSRDLTCCCVSCAWSRCVSCAWSRISGSPRRRSARNRAAGTLCRVRSARSS